MVISEKILTEMVKESMRETAPQMFAELNSEGTLEEVAKMRAKAAMETYYDLMSAARDVAATSNLESMERVREQMTANRQAAEIAVAQAIEFPDETTESDFDDF